MLLIRDINYSSDLIPCHPVFPLSLHSFLKCYLAHRDANLTFSEVYYVIRALRLTLMFPWNI